MDKKNKKEVKESNKTVWIFLILGLVAGGIFGYSFGTYDRNIVGRTVSSTSKNVAVPYEPCTGDHCKVTSPCDSLCKKNFLGVAPICGYYCGPSRRGFRETCSWFQNLLSDCNTWCEHEKNAMCPSDGDLCPCHRE